MNRSTSTSRGPIFVGGTGRSGTTVFARLLGTHPRIFSLRWESQFIVARHGLLDLIDSGFGDAQLAKFLELMRGRWFRRTLNKGKPNEYEAGLSDDVSGQRLERSIADLEERTRHGGDADGNRAAAEFISRLLEEPTVKAGAARWCEKTPRNSLYMDRLAEMFPDARFINVVRDGRDVACSMVERSFWPIGATHDFPTTDPFRGAVTFEKAIAYWVEMIRLAREVADRLPKGSYMGVRLEDLVFDQKSAIRQISDFLGEPLDDSLFQFEMRSGSLGRWKRDLTPEQVHLAEKVAGEVLSAEGYLG